MKFAARHATDRLIPNSAVQPPVPTASSLVRKGRKGIACIQSASPEKLGDSPREISIREFL
jgi:hypothetical protein